MSYCFFWCLSTETCIIKGGFVHVTEILQPMGEAQRRAAFRFRLFFAIPYQITL